VRLRFAVAGLLLCSRLTATLVPGPNLAKRTEAADVIVVGTLIRGTTFASGSQVSSDLVLEVRRVLKGKLMIGEQATAHLEGRGLFQAPNPARSAIPRIYGIWFLSAASVPDTVISRDGQLGDPYMAAVILPEEAPPGKSGGSPAESVANELAAALRWVAEVHAVELNPKRAGQYAGTFRTLTENLATLGGAVTAPVYREFSTDKSPHLRMAGIQGLIAEGDPGGVKRAAAEWDELAASADVNPIIGALMGYSNASDPDAVRALGALALRPDAEAGLRENTVYALRAIHTREALPALVALLDDKSEQIQSYALSGLCLFARNGPPVTPQSIPPMSWLESRQPTPYLTPETQRYCFLGGHLDAALAGANIGFWKSWWTEHRVELEKP
jgi:hypothetical protein